MELLYSLMRVLFPDFCHKCGIYGSIICESCTQKLPASTSLLPPNCFAALSYRDPTTRTIVISLKTRPNPTVATLLSKRMYDAVAEELSDLTHIKNFKDPLIIPIPGSPSKLSTYGFNHADILADAFAKQLSEYAPQVTPHILTKKQTKTKQARATNRAERFQNMSHAFTLNTGAAEKLNNACVIIIDDIITTGATCLSARQLLLDAGARQVLCISIAH